MTIVCAQKTTTGVLLGALFAFNYGCGDLPNEEVAKERLSIAMEACVEFSECIRLPWSFVSTNKL